MNQLSDSHRRPSRSTHRALAVALVATTLFGSGVAEADEASDDPSAFNPIVYEPSPEATRVSFSEPRVVEVDHSPAMRNAGIVLTALGTVGMGVGLAAVIGMTNPCDGPCHDVEGLATIGWGMAGIASGGVALLGLGIGIPLWVVGERDDTVRSDDPRAREQARAAPTLTVGPTAVSFGWSF